MVKNGVIGLFLTVIAMLNFWDQHFLRSQWMLLDHKSHRRGKHNFLCFYYLHAFRKNMKICYQKNLVYVLPKALCASVRGKIMRRVVVNIEGNVGLTKFYIALMDDCPYVKSIWLMAYFIFGCFLLQISA